MPVRGSSDEGFSDEALSDDSNSLLPARSYSFSGRLPRAWPWNLILFFLTLLTSTGFGSAAVASYRQTRPLTLEMVMDAYLRLIHFDNAVWSGLWFSLPLLTILLAHELGHYLQCSRRQIEASWPYFLPSPSLFGTFGAFIRIRSPIYSREGLFDIGIGGPLAGFAALFPFLVIGIFLSKTVVSATSPDPVLFGTPLLVRLAGLIRFPGVPAADILFHPMALAAWAGLFATALNLLPIGQLDGGHIVYALAGEQWHTRVSLAFVLLLAIAGFFYWPWWFWGAAMFFFGRRHPLVYDNTPLSRGRVLLCLAALLIFLLSLTIVPVRSL